MADNINWKNFDKELHQKTQDNFNSLWNECGYFGSSKKGVEKYYNQIIQQYRNKIYDLNVLNSNQQEIYNNKLLQLEKIKTELLNQQQNYRNQLSVMTKDWEAKLIEIDKNFTTKSQFKNNQTIDNLLIIQQEIFNNLLDFMAQLQNKIKKYENTNYINQVLNQQYDQQYMYSTDQSYNDYDLTINFTKLSKIIEGIQVRKNSSLSQQTHDKMCINPVILVGFLGPFNSGKSFLLSQLQNKQYKQGLNYKTEGFNLAYNHENQILYIDTAGNGEPISVYERMANLKDKLNQYNKLQDFSQQEYDQIKKEIKQEENFINKQKQEIYEQHIASEKFVQSFILNQSHVIIFVVGILRSDEERMINFVCQTIEKRNDQIIIICHNFHNLSTEQSIKQKIQKDIFNTFNILNMNDLNNEKFTGFYDYSFNECNPIIHLIFAKQNTTAGVKYNEKTLQIIKDHIFMSKTQKKPVNFIDCMVEYFNQNLPSYFQVTGNQDNFIKNNEQAASQSITATKRIIEYKNDQLVATDQTWKMMPKKIYFNFSGNIIENYSGEFYEPNYTIVQNEQNFTILFECAGINKIIENNSNKIVENSIIVKILKDVKVSKYLLKLEGWRNLSIQQKTDFNKNDEQKIIQGKISQNVYICSLEYELKYKQPQITIQDGVIYIQVDIDWPMSQIFSEEENY